jgi:uncharacterized protein (DUF58 family)
VEKFIPPRKGRKHILRIIRELLDFTPAGATTSLDEPLRYLTNAMKKRCTAFIISDFIAPDFEKALRIASSKHDIAALRVFDDAERTLPELGLVLVNDPETGEEKWIDTSSRTVRDEYRKFWENGIARNDRIFNRCGVDTADIATNGDYVKPLLALFKRR